MKRRTHSPHQVKGRCSTHQFPAKKKWSIHITELFRARTPIWPHRPCANIAATAETNHKIFRLLCEFINGSPRQLKTFGYSKATTLPMPKCREKSRCSKIGLTSPILYPTQNDKFRRTENAEEQRINERIQGELSSTIYLEVAFHQR